MKIREVFGRKLSRLSALAALGLTPLAASAVDYQASVLSDNPLAYYRLNDPTTRPAAARNLGSVGAPGNGTSTDAVPVGGALVGSPNAALYYHSKPGASGAHTLVPFQAANNPVETDSFTIEAWFMVTEEVSDAPGPCPLFNRLSSGDRQGWVFFQRSPTTGWNFRMYDGSGSHVGVSVTGQSSAEGAGKAGTWSHMVVTWDGPNSTATMYVNGENVASATGTFVANKPENARSISIGSYDDGANPFNGAVDEVALYPKVLSEASIKAHFSNGTNALRAVSYPSLVLAEGPTEYLRLDESASGDDLAANFGSLGRDGHAIHGPGVRHPSGGLPGSGDSAAGYRGKNGGGGGVNTQIPWNAALNPDAASSFTIEAWLKVLHEVSDSPGPAPLMNRFSYPGADRQGWVFFQRSPASGWNFRTYTGVGSGTGINMTGQSSLEGSGTYGTWTHLVVAYDGGSATATMYVNGEEVVSQSGAYAPNTADHGAQAPANLSIGSYNNTQPGENPFDGVVDEVAFYSEALTLDQVTAHYQSGTNALQSAGYAAVVLADKPVEYLRMGEPAYNPAANSGSLGEKADGAYIFGANGAAGPQPPAFTGFATGNLADALDGKLNTISLGDPAGLNFSGQITVEAWVQPAATQSAAADIVAHGQGDDGLTGAALFVSEGANYNFGSADATSPHGVSFAIPSEDLTGTAWVHLAGTYDGTAWNLYRNGVKVASNPDAVGALALNDSQWSIGARGDGSANAFAGVVDEVAIYNKALTAQRIAAHYAAGLIDIPAQPVPGTPESNGLVSLGNTTYVNSPATSVNNNSTEALGVAVLSNGNSVIAWEDDGDDLADQEAVWTIFSPTGSPLTQPVTITTIDPNFAGQTLQSSFLSFFRSDGSAISGRTAWGPKIKANLFGPGFGMGATAFDLGIEVPELAAVQFNAAGDNAGDFPAVQLLSNTGTPQGIVSGVTDEYAERDGDIRIGDWDKLSNGNLVVVGESRQRPDLVDIYGGAEAKTHGIVRVIKADGTEVKSTQLLGSDPVEVQIWHGTAVTANGFAVRFASAGVAKLRFFKNDGTPLGDNVDAAELTGSPISSGGGRGEDIGFHGNGKDAYVLATKGTDEGGAPQIWVAVINADGTKRWSRTLSDIGSLPHTKIGRVDAAISADGKVVVVYDDTAATAAAGGASSLVLGRLFDAQGAPIGGVFGVSEKELPTAEVLASSTPRVDWTGNTISVAWISKNLADGNPDGKSVIAFRSFKLPGGVAELRVTGATKTATSVDLTWTGGEGPFLVEGKFSLSDATWTKLVTTADRSASIPLVGSSMFLRVQDKTTDTVKLFRAELNGANEAPAVATPGTGRGLLAVNGTDGFYFISYQNLRGSATLSHIHGPAPVGTSAGVLIGLKAPTGTAGFITGNITVSAGNLATIEAGNTYFNIHAAPPGAGSGEIRGQLVK